MVDSKRRWIGTAFIAVGALLILAVIGYVGWSQVSAQRLRAELRAGTGASAGTEAAATGTPALAVAATAKPPDTPAPAASAAPSVAPSRTLAATQQPTSASLVAAATPAATDTRVPATPTRAPTATRQPTRVPPATATSAAAAPVSTSGQGVEAVRLAIPDLKIDAKVVPMSWEVVETKQGPQSQWVIPKNEAGRHVNSAKLGEQGNLVISGHNNIYGRVFLRISQAWDDATRIKVDEFTDRSDILTGRTVTLYDATGKAYQYLIKDFLRLRDTGVSYEQRVQNGRFIMPTETSQLTIVTCWPPTNNTHRLIVIAEPVN